MNHQDFLTEKEQEKQKLYFVHHMHHYQDGDQAQHELHHCPLFTKPNLEGDQYSLEHLVFAEKLYHVLDRKSENVLYDHANNSYQIKELNFSNKKYYTIY